MIGKPSAQDSFSARCPEAQRAAREAALPSQHGSWPRVVPGEAHTCAKAPGFLVIKTDQPRRGPALPPGWPKPNEDVCDPGARPAQRKECCWLLPAQPSSENSTSWPVVVFLPPVEKRRRNFLVDNPGFARAITSTKRTCRSSSGQSDNGPELSSGPRMCPLSGAQSKLTTVASRRIGRGTSLGTFRKATVKRASEGRISTALRQRYFSLFLAECHKFSRPQEAAETAWSEEQMAYNSSPSEDVYVRLALEVLRKLRGLVPSAVPGLHRAALYSRLRDYVLSQEQLHGHGYPFPHPQKPGAALLLGALEEPRHGLRICCRCGSQYAVSSSGGCVSADPCRYHWGRLQHRPVAAGWESRYSCCLAPAGSRGCEVARRHVRDGRKEDLQGFVRTVEKPLREDAHPGVYALDCEMCYTTHGLELTRVTVVDTEMRVVYDTFVKPNNQIVDYNTRFSGVTQDHLASCRTRLPHVQTALLSLFSADTILIGHSLQCDLLALKLIHHSVVDTAVLFPHPRGLPYKCSLRSLMARYLSRSIQTSASGHSPREDASACMHLVFWKLQEDSAHKDTLGPLPSV
ncbi:RNA exonuclease 1 homolog [Urocitellus parryii]